MQVNTNNEDPSTANVIIFCDNYYLDVQVANYDFFKEMEEKCCSKLHHYEFTVYSPAPARRPSQLTSEGDSIPANEGVSDQEDEGLSKAVEKIKLSNGKRGVYLFINHLNTSITQSI